MAIQVIKVKDANDVIQRILVDKVATENTQIVKVGFGADDTAPTLASATNPLPVVVSGTLEIANGVTPLDTASDSDPPIDIIAVTKSDSTADPNGPFRGFIIGTVGIIKVQTSAGNTRTVPSGVYAAGVEHSLKFTRIWNTGTTAVDIWGLV